MPKYTIYIREVDNEKWLAIQDKPKWLHHHLNGLELKTIAPTVLCKHYQPKGKCLVKGCTYAN